MTDSEARFPETPMKWQVVEVHDWPERAVRGPSVVVAHGLSEQQANEIRDDLERKRTGRYRYEACKEDR